MRDHETGLRHEEFKRIVLLEIIDKGYNIVELWDDNPEVIEVAKIMIPRAKISISTH
jgi:hypothetical protein